jgi:Bacteriophage HK97-gp10, putative tail-component
MPTRIVLTSRIPEIVAHADAMGPLIVARTGADIEAGAKERIVANGSVDTSNMLNSVAWTPTDELSGEVVVGAEYGVFVENGSHHPARARQDREGGLDVTVEYTIGPKPFLAPAAEDARPGFEAATARLFD